MRALLRRRDVRLLLGGQSLSMFGDWAMIIALGIWARVLTGSNAEAGIVFLCFGATGMIAPLGGLVVDRLPKRQLMIATHLALAGVMCLLLLVNSRSQLWLLYAITLLYGLGGDIFAAARSSMLKAMLPDEELGEANGILQSVPKASASSRPSPAPGCSQHSAVTSSRSSTPPPSSDRPRRSSRFRSMSRPSRRASSIFCARPLRVSPTSRVPRCYAS